MSAGQWEALFMEEVQARRAAEARCRELEEALEFYADRENWKDRMSAPPAAVMNGGERARSALARHREATGQEKGA